MKGVILAGGLGSRLYPLTKATNKHLLPVGCEPMLFHPIRQLVSAGIEDILVVTSTQHMGDVVRCLGSGADFDCKLSYKVQEEAGGIAHALALAEDFAFGSKICVILGDNIFEFSIKPYADNFDKQKSGAHVLLKEVGDPERYGVAALDEYQVIDIEEKPVNPKSSFAVVGLYFYDEHVFDIIRSTDASERGEMEITAVNNIYIRKKQLGFSICQGRWTDAGTFDSLFEANQLLMASQNRIMT
ncbi:MAG: NTP transferase domain-containing protein [Gammaproteobacteria bacterium]|nr:NTP transferase domain-containing protein [Gammaproteobacteria bacterium]